MIDQYLDIKSIDPIYWGKSGWIFLNSIGLTYRPENKIKYKLLIEQLPYILPCRTCGNNLFKNLDGLDEALESKENLLRWLLKIRNDINIEQGRKIKTLQSNINEIFSTKYSYGINVEIIVTTVGLIILVLVLIYIYKTQKN